MKSLSINQMALIEGKKCGKAKYNLCMKAFLGYVYATNPLAFAAFWAVYQGNNCDQCIEVP